MCKIKYNLRRGDYLFLDVDDTLLLCGHGENKYQTAALIGETELADVIRHTQDSGIIVCGLSLRSIEFKEETEKQLEIVDIHSLTKQEGFPIDLSTGLHNSFPQF